MTIRHDLVNGLHARLVGRPVADVTEVVAPPGGSAERRSPFTVVVLATGAAGLCWNLLEDERSRRAYDDLDLRQTAGRDALAVAADLLHAELARRLVGYAACGALSQELFASGEVALDEAADLLDVLRPDATDRVGVVGDSPPLVRALAARAREVVVVQRRPAPSGPGNVRRTESASALADCNKVLVTSSSVLDDSFDEIEGLTRGAAFRVLYGPAAGILPDPFFARGFHAVAGTRVLAGARLAQRQRAGEPWGDAKCKFVARRQ